MKTLRFEEACAFAEDLKQETYKKLQEQGKSAKSIAKFMEQMRKIYKHE